MLKNKWPFLKERNTLGRSCIQVSPLCFGTLTLGPLQAGLSLKDGARLICHALERGINFFDTADLYGTYPYLKAALKGRSEEAVIASKSYDHTRQGMMRSLEKALRETGRDWIDIFLLHEQENALTLKGHAEALEYLIEAKEKGMVRAVGISTHHVAAVRAAGSMAETDIIHPVLNISGIGIQDGTPENMMEALEAAARRGVGLYAMKPLGGGHLIGRARQALQFIRDLPYLASTAVGMQEEREVDVNCYYFSREVPPLELEEGLAGRKRRLIIHDWCRGCGSCLKACSSGALNLDNGRASVSEKKCILCGYCGSRCPDFCLKII